ncbi:MAG: transcriptional regulator [Robiginitomaculum sp.]|nr:MAG: transcriptional regulator [Robiginitomaculum sp.]
MKSVSKTGPTRRTILDFLKRNGPVSATHLADELGVTAMAVRQHLYALQDQKMVATTSQAGQRGRPVKLWSLTTETQALFPDAHQDLAVELLNHMRSAFGEKGLHTIIDKHSQSQTENYAKALHSISQLSDRLQQLALIRSSEGYMAEVQADGDDWLFIENHCPICAAARQCTRLCANELQVFQSVLGPDLTITREEHILQGPRRCLYRIKAT